MAKENVAHGKFSGKPAPVSQEISARFGTVNCAAGLLEALWTASQKTLTPQEVRQIALAGEELSHEARNLAESISNVGCLVDGDHLATGARSGSLDDCSVYLFNISQHLEVLARAQYIVSQATFRAMEGDAA